jgi:hypothetical protein
MRNHYIQFFSSGSRTISESKKSGALALSRGSDIHHHQIRRASSNDRRRNLAVPAVNTAILTSANNGQK